MRVLPVTVLAHSGPKIPEKRCAGAKTAMNTDIRLSVLFFDHPKTLKLRRRLGPEGVECLLRLWVWAAQNRPDGDFHGMDEEDIEIAARWVNESLTFCQTLVELRWLDVAGSPNSYHLHDWKDHNPWAANSEIRGDKARFSRLARVDKAAYDDLAKNGYSSISKSYYESLTNRQRQPNDPVTPSPAPSPSPSPSPKDKQLLSPSAPVDHCPHQEIIEIYHQTLPAHRRVVAWTEKRKAALKARWRENKSRQNLDWWKKYFQRVANSDFLSGKIPGRNGNKPFLADLEWLINSSNLVKLLEGKYDDNTRTGAQIPDRVAETKKMLDKIERGEA